LRGRRLRDARCGGCIVLRRRSGCFRRRWRRTRCRLTGRRGLRPSGWRLRRRLGGRGRLFLLSSRLLWRRRRLGLALLIGGRDRRRLRRRDRSRSNIEPAAYHEEPDDQDVPIAQSSPDSGPHSLLPSSQNEPASAIGGSRDRSGPVFSRSLEPKHPSEFDLGQSRRCRNPARSSHLRPGAAVRSGDGAGRGFFAGERHRRGP